MTSERAFLEQEETTMNVKEAIQVAATYTADMETLANPDDKAIFLNKSGFAIESTRFLDGEDLWEIGVGFVRDCDRVRNFGLASLGGGELAHDRRTYKTVMISDATGSVVTYK